ncbi:MAG: SDR family oxidoreductase [Actinomycetota bacterium]|nr:SDR family oxidoreductase [Actinomycetota bacterium]
MTVLVTGATGHLGRMTIEQLLRIGFPADQIVAAGRGTERLADLAARGVRTRSLSYDDSASLVSAFADVEVVLLVSGSEVGRRTGQHANAIDGAVQAGVKRLIYTSAPHADTSELVVAPEHRATEQHLLASGLEYTVLRNGWYTENYTAALRQARETGVIVGSAGAGRVASASRADYAAAAAAVLVGTGHENKVYELTGDTSWDYDELAAAAGEVLGREVTYQQVDAAEHRRLLHGAGLPEELVGFLVAIDAGIRDGLLAETTATLSELIGRPTTRLVEGLRAAVVSG